MSDTNVRRDKKFWVSLELHREIERVLNVDPERVRTRGLEGVELVLPNVRSDGGRELVEVWRGLLTNRDWEQTRHYLTSEDEVSVEMRNLTVFLGIITQERRQEIVDELLARPCVHA